jgi:hypothetical protein
MLLQLPMYYFGSLGGSGNGVNVLWSTKFARTIAALFAMPLPREQARR